ncbi:AraC family transcriptional regulator [Ammoniphilus sp. YIM 78166]|uniref:AraC family transcriptional regulator n=1 Tax=Ammoniphilus sp. YIM 78166 TaxID=1644106 RepID=UPI00106F141E|nr:AraC family transcriptional regulator [Ammoniphilus sp. YIM 78166]
MTDIGELVKRLNRLVFSLLLVGHKKCDATWYQSPREHPFHSLWLVVKGRGEFTIDGVHYPVEQGKLFFFTPGMVCERVSNPENPLEYYFLRFSFAEAHQDKEDWQLLSSKSLQFPLRGMYSLQNPLPIIKVVEQLDYYWKRRGSIIQMKRKIFFQELLLLIMQDLRVQKMEGDTNMMLDRTIDYMVNHYQEAVALENLANIAGLSLSHYSRQFKKYMGYTPMEYLTHLRVDRAKELLILSDYRLKAVAESVGYQDEFYFSRVFKKIEGVSPTEFVKLNKMRPAT